MKFDLLKTMLEMQEKFQWRFENKFKFKPTLKDMVCAIAAEAIGESWKTAGGKWWSEKEYSREEKVVELIDILHFWLCACIEVGLTAEEIFEVYSKKLAENYRRQFKKGGYKG